MNNLSSSHLQKVVDEVINNNEKYTQYYLKKFGISQPNMSKIRAGKIQRGNLRLLTIQRMLNAYNAKNGE